MYVHTYICSKHGTISLLIISCTIALLVYHTNYVSILDNNQQYAYHRSEKKKEQLVL